MICISEAFETALEKECKLHFESQKEHWLESSEFIDMIERRLHKLMCSAEVRLWVKDGEVKVYISTFNEHFIDGNAPNISFKDLIKEEVSNNDPGLLELIKKEVNSIK